MKTVQNIDEYRIGTDLPGAPTLQEAVSLLDRLIEEPSFLDAWIPQILDEARQAGEWDGGGRRRARGRPPGWTVLEKTRRSWTRGYRRYWMKRGRQRNGTWPAAATRRT